VLNKFWLESDIPECKVSRLIIVFLMANFNAEKAKPFMVVFVSKLKKCPLRIIR